MKLKEAMSIIDEKEKGFMVHFDVSDGRVKYSDYFPDKHAGEKLIKTEEEAWDLAKRFANAAPDNYNNIYVIDNNFSPVFDYDSKKLKRY